jgi:hypothetical protein
MKGLTFGADDLATLVAPSVKAMPPLVGRGLLRIILFFLEVPEAGVEPARGFLPSGF